MSAASATATAAAAPSPSSSETPESKLADDDYHTMVPKKIVRYMQAVKIEPWDAHEPAALMIFESLIANNYAVYDDFMDPPEARALRDEVKRMYDEGRMTDGKIGKNAAGTDGDVRPDMRTDKMLWLEGSESFVGKALRRHILRIDILAQKINLLCHSLATEHGWEGCGRCKIMLTCYPRGGKRYVPHYDNPNRNGRKVTIILYLNEWWKEGDGGTLRAKTNGVQVDVAPLFNRLFVFWSDRRVPHEVLPTAEGKDRFAITIWYMDDREKRLGPL